MKKEEIKEILDNFKNNYDELGSCYYPEDILGPEDLKLLYDYITNLQEENKQLKELCDKYEEEHNTTFIEWQKDIKTNKKAIEYMKNYIEVEDAPINERIKIEFKELLDILKGDDTNVKDR